MCVIYLLLRQSHENQEMTLDSKSKRLMFRLRDFAQCGIGPLPTAVNSDLHL